MAFNAQFGPNTPQVNAFLDRLARLTEEESRLLAQLHRDAWEAVTPARTRALDDPWLFALTQAQDAWTEEEFPAMTRATAAAMHAVEALLGTDRFDGWALEASRRAAAGLVIRPWVDEAVFLKAYGVLADVVGVEKRPEVPGG